MNFLSLKQSILPLITFLLIAQVGIAQPDNPPPQRRQGGGQFITMEKQMVLDSIPDLNADQKMIITAIYDDYEKAFSETRTETAGDREQMRSRMTTLRDNKNEALKAAMTEEQFLEYEALITRIRNRMQNRRQRGNG